MKTRQIARAAVAAAIFAGAATAFAGNNSDLHVVYCKATIMSESGDPNNQVSVTLPPTEGYYDDNGNPLTYWNVGNVPSGGVADSWHAEGGPGRFTAHNTGTQGAYVYVSTAGWYCGYSTDMWDNGNSVYYNSTTNIYENVGQNGELFGGGYTLECPAISPSELRRWWQNNGDGDDRSYHLAFTTDVTAKVPTWHSLDHRFYRSNSGSGSDKYGYWITEEMSDPNSSEVFGFMGYVEAGDYLTFDMKFWAPRMDWSLNEPVLFTFCVEAASFPLWDHGRVVE